MESCNFLHNPTDKQTNLPMDRQMDTGENISSFAEAMSHCKFKCTVKCSTFEWGDKLHFSVPAQHLHTIEQINTQRGGSFTFQKCVSGENQVPSETIILYPPVPRT